MNKDLTTGEPKKVLWAFCLPMFGSIVFQQLYNIADSLVAGKFIGENALAAVGNSYNITLIFIAFAFGCNIGCSVIVSQLFGARDFRRMKTAVHTSLIASGVLCAVLMVVGLLSAETLLNLMRTQPEVLADSLLYLRIYLFGLPFLFFYNIATGIFSALGDSKTPFLFLAFSSSANILVDILFVKGFSMGIAGVAWATFLCQGISCIFSVLLVLRRLQTLKTEGAIPLFSGQLLGKIAVIAVPSILQQSFISVGNMMIQGCINDFGVSVAAGYSAAVKLNNLVITFRPKPWCEPLRQDKGGIFCGTETGLVSLHSLLPRLCLIWKIFTFTFYGSEFCHSTAHWKAVFMDSLPVLFCCLHKACGGWHSAWEGGNVKIYGSHIHRFDFARDLVFCSLRVSRFSYRHMVFLADWLVYCNGTFPFVLPGGVPGI